MSEPARRSLGEPHPSRLDPDRQDRDEILRRHEAAMTLGVSGYEDPATGYFVFTAAFLAARRRCCETGCRHCPFIE